MVKFWGFVDFVCIMIHFKLNLKVGYSNFDIKGSVEALFVDGCPQL